jgi:hypothetical protein
MLLIDVEAELGWVITGELGPDTRLHKYPVIFPLVVVPEPVKVKLLAGNCIVWEFPASATGGFGSISSSFWHPVKIKLIKAKNTRDRLMAIINGFWWSNYKLNLKKHSIRMIYPINFL